MSETLPIYVGRECIGTVRETRDRCEAFDAQGNAVGVFPNREKAATAIYEHHRQVGVVIGGG